MRGRKRIQQLAGGEQVVLIQALDVNGLEVATVVLHLRVQHHRAVHADLAGHGGEDPEQADHRRVVRTDLRGVGVVAVYLIFIMSRYFMTGFLQLALSCKSRLYLHPRL